MRCRWSSIADRASIRPARPDDLETLRAVEVAAGRVFAEIGMADIAADEPLSVETLRRYQQDGRAWVATDAVGAPVAYILVDAVDGNAHIEQVSVHPDWSHRGIGRELIDHVAVWAETRDLSAITLTTFRDVAWNAPYYARCDFVTVADSELSPGLARIRAHEAARGLDRYGRVTMRRATSRDTS